MTNNPATSSLLPRIKSKVIKTENLSGLQLYLPKIWLDFQNLKRRDELYFLRNTRNQVIVSSVPDTEPGETRLKKRSIGRAGYRGLGVLIPREVLADWAVEIGGVLDYYEDEKSRLVIEYRKPGEKKESA